MRMIPSYNEQFAMENDPFVDDFPIKYAECPSHTAKLPEGIAKTDAPHQHVEKWPV